MAGSYVAAMSLFKASFLPQTVKMINLREAPASFSQSLECFFDMSQSAGLASLFSAQTQMHSLLQCHAGLPLKQWELEDAVEARAIKRARQAETTVCMIGQDLLRNSPRDELHFHGFLAGRSSPT